MVLVRLRTHLVQDRGITNPHEKPIGQQNTLSGLLGSDCSPHSVPPWAAMMQAGAVASRATGRSFSSGRR
jgi:hypothetical protein